MSIYISVSNRIFTTQTSKVDRIFSITNITLVVVALRVWRFFSVATEQSCLLEREKRQGPISLLTSTLMSEVPVVTNQLSRQRVLV